MAKVEIILKVVRGIIPQASLGISIKISEEAGVKEAINTLQKAIAQKFNIGKDECLVYEGRGETILAETIKYLGPERYWPLRHYIESEEIGGKWDRKDKRNSHHFFTVPKFSWTKWEVYLCK